MKVTMYDKLLLLPLFQGLGEEDLTRILEKVKLHFRKYPADSYIISREQSCKELIFVLEGSIQAETTDEEFHFSLYETLDSPCILEPYSLFGMQTAYHSSYRTLTEAGVLSIDKGYVLSILSQYEIFRLNMLNMLCNRAQTVRLRSWNTHVGNTLQKIVNFVYLRSTQTSGHKQLRIRMEDLATLIDDTRINVSKALNELKAAHLVDLGRKAIDIHDMEALLQYIR